MHVSHDQCVLYSNSYCTCVVCIHQCTHAHTVHLGPVVYSGYNISVADSVVIGAVVLAVLGVALCFVADVIYQRKRRKHASQRGKAASSTKEPQFSEN